MSEPLCNCARLAARPLPEGGTPAREWTGWGRRFAPLNIGHCPALLLVAAHPDDETLGLGATAAALAQRGVAVQVVAVTDGEAAYQQDGGGSALAGLRRDEMVAAAARLGLPRPIFLGIPDGEVTADEDRVEVELEALLADSSPGTWCAAPWRGDGHPDHEATGRAAAAASRDVPSAFIEYPIWMWHWALPADLAVPWDRVRRMPLTSRDSAAKEGALRRFSSQLQRVEGPKPLAPEAIARQMAVGEVVFV
ncbi:PIG-L deacetylase family protein [Mycobacterium sp. ITM-2016-00318]|uniref:PIG-L deacetylase family protein n=1 Tax=Mycobacterium sp. ITM-2016-00318 TaxID=2099693 RepID=UPI000CF99DEB|nr:PIG-L family deacetylase [Mycobacterium sp. ITM-2016-00318]WNG93512.1 PIG-L family deacetylase [Mycobacterium sp. ITM-2016-00318]